MRLTAHRTIASLTLGLCLSSALAATAPAVAAPLAGSPASTVADAARANATVEPVVLVRKCWTRRGIAHCRWIDGAVRPYRWWDPNRFPTGSTAWWRQMDREGRGGFRR